MSEEGGTREDGCLMTVTRALSVAIMVVGFLIWVL